QRHGGAALIFQPAIAEGMPPAGTDACRQAPPRSPLDARGAAQAEGAVADLIALAVLGAKGIAIQPRIGQFAETLDAEVAEIQGIAELAEYLAAVPVGRAPVAVMAAPGRPQLHADLVVDLGTGVGAEVQALD